MGDVLFGTSSWTAKGWLGTVYPKGTPQGEWLAHYAKRFRTVEADVTYYRVPGRDMVQRWADATPDEFVLSAKFPRSVVHRGDGPQPDAKTILLPDVVGEDVEAFLDAMALLGGKCGPLDLVTTDFVYARLIGDRKAVEERTTTFDQIVIDRTDRIRGWASLIDAYSKRVPKFYVYANNHYAGHAPATIEQLASLLRA